MENLEKRLKDIKLFLLDLDGTIYLEDQLIPGAAKFIDTLIEKKKDYVFLTNNSSKSASHYITKLEKMNIPVTPDNVFTSGQSTARYLAGAKENCRIYLVGTELLKKELVESGIEVVDSKEENIDFVVVGFDTELVYKKLEIACSLIDDGVPFIATNPDLVCPLKNKRYIPDCGSMCEMIFNATGKRPTYFGKPDRKMAEILCSKKGIDADASVIIGDRLYTDMALGHNAGITSICVLSGETEEHQIADSDVKPDFVIESVAKLIDIL